MDRDTEQAPNEWKHCKHENLQEAAYKLETKCDVYLNQLISCYSTFILLIKFSCPLYLSSPI